MEILNVLLESGRRGDEMKKGRGVGVGVNVGVS